MLTQFILDVTSMEKRTSRRVQTGPCLVPRGCRREGRALPGPLSPLWNRCLTPHLSPASAHCQSPEKQMGGEMKRRRVGVSLSSVVSSVESWHHRPFVFFSFENMSYDRTCKVGAAEANKNPLSKYCLHDDRCGASNYTSHMILYLGYSMVFYLLYGTNRLRISHQNISAALAQKWNRMYS